jgi:hypothetical protein
MLVSRTITGRTPPPEAARDCPGLKSGLIVDGTGDDGLFADFEAATRAYPDTPIGDESLGRRSRLGGVGVDRR